MGQKIFEDVWIGFPTTLAPGYGINTDTFLLMGIFMCVSIEDNSVGGGYTAPLEMEVRRERSSVIYIKSRFVW